MTEKSGEYINNDFFFIFFQVPHNSLGRMLGFGIDEVRQGNAGTPFD